jgi:hypothetical protein
MSEQAKQATEAMRDGLHIRRCMVIELAWARAIQQAKREWPSGVPLVTNDTPGFGRTGAHPENDKFLPGWKLYAGASWTGEWEVWGQRNGEHFEKRGKVKL